MTPAVVVVIGLAMLARAFLADRQAAGLRVNYRYRFTATWARAESLELAARTWRAAGLALVGLALLVWAAR